MAHQHVQGGTAMARQPRYVLPGQPQHVIQRGNNRDVIFVAEADHRFYLDKLKDACDSMGCEVHAYVLMTNHVHLLMTPYEQNSLGRVMQSLGRRYVQYFNHRYRRTGTLWEGRYRATLIDAESYLLTCYRYIELNPLRAGMVSHPADYPWSSYRSNALGQPDALISEHALYRCLGMSDGERCRCYRNLFDECIRKETLETIREATNKAWVLGNDCFRARIEDLVNRRTAPKTRGGDRKSVDYLRGRQINRV
jgi:putative transposase